MTAETEVRVKVIPELSEDMTALLGTATEDTLEKINAGAALVYALYHCQADIVAALPGPVHAALARAQAAYGVGRG